MLVLLFELGSDRYALDVSQIVEVLPLVDLRRLPEAPTGVAGIFDFRGTPVPAIDLAQLTLGRPAAPRLSTRLVVVTLPSAPGESSETRVFGLIVERATTTVQRDAAEFVWLRTKDEAKYLGPVATDKRGLLQLIDLQQLLRTYGGNLPFAALVEA